MTSPTVSVLMTAYNRGKYIAEAIESVLASNFADFELIIVDDGSTDRTVEVARRYLSDPRVQVHVNESNLGDYPNRNRAAALARGKYLKYVDSDDLIYPHSLGMMVAAMEQFPQAGLGLCRPSPISPYPSLVLPTEAYREHFLGPGLLTNAPLSAILRHDHFQAAGGFSGVRYAGDSEMWLKLAAVAPVVIIPHPLTWWRSHGEQEYVYGIHSHAYAEMNYKIALEALLSPCCPLESAEREQAIRRLKRQQARMLLVLGIKRRNPVTAWQLFRKSGLSAIDLVKAVP